MKVGTAGWFRDEGWWRCLDAIEISSCQKKNGVIRLLWYWLCIFSSSWPCQFKGLAIQVFMADAVPGRFGFSTSMPPKGQPCLHPPARCQFNIFQLPDTFPISYAEIVHFDFAWSDKLSFAPSGLPLTGIICRIIMGNMHSSGQFCAIFRTRLKEKRTATYHSFFCRFFWRSMHTYNCSETCANTFGFLWR